MHDELFSENGLSMERLRAFAEVVAAGSPTRAAKGDPTRQSQYSRQLKELEGFFGAELFVRRGGSWRLTAPGTELRRLTNEHLGALAELHAHCAGESVALRVAAGESFLQWRLLPRLDRLCEELSGARLVLLNRRSEDIAAELLAGELEFGVLPVGNVPVSLGSASITPMEFRLFVPCSLLKDGAKSKPGWPLSLPLAVLEGGGSARDVLTAESARLGLKLNLVVECSSHLQVAEVVRQGLAAAVLPTEAQANFANDTVEAIPLACLRKATRHTALVWSARLVRTRPVVGEAAHALVRILTLKQRKI